MSLETAVSGPDIAALNLTFEFQRTGFPLVTTAADIRVTVLGPYSHEAVIQKSATSVAYRFVVPGFAEATFEEVEGSGSNDGFYSVSSADGTISWSLSLTASVSHTIVVRGKHDGLLGDALFTLALSVSFCDASGSEGDDTSYYYQLYQAVARGGEVGVGRACELLRQEGAHAGGAYYSGHTLLHWAASYNNLDMVKLLLSRNDVDVNALSTGGGYYTNRTPLHLAVTEGNWDVVKYLLSRDDVDVNVQDMWDGSLSSTPLHYMMDADILDAGVFDVVKKFLARDDVDVNVQDHLGRTPLYRALSKSYSYRYSSRYEDSSYEDGFDEYKNYDGYKLRFYSKEKVKHMSFYDGIDATSRADDGTAPLHFATRYFPVGFVALETYEAVLAITPINLRNSINGKTPLDYAVTPPDSAASRLWSSRVSSLRALGGVCLVETVKNCGLIMRPLHSTVVVAENHIGAALAVTATTRSDVPPVYKLIHSTANSNNFSLDSATGILTVKPGFLTEGLLVTVSIQAAAGAQSVTVERVISVSAASASPLADALPSSRLTAAAEYMGVVAALTATVERVTVSYRSGLDKTRFALATLSSGKEALSLVLPLGGENVTATAVVALSARGYALETVTVRVTVAALLPVKTLVTILPNIADISLRLSARYGGTRYEKIGGSDKLSVLDSGEISITVSRLSNFAWHRLEARADSPGVLGGERFLVSLLASPCAPGELPTSAEAANLIEAVDRGIEIGGICRMIKEGADVNVTNSTGGTPLHRAVGGEYYAAASLLIAAGADVNVQNKKGKTPLYLAVSRGYTEMVSLFLSAGAETDARDENGRTLLHLVVSLEHAEMVSLFLSAGAEEIDARDENGRTPLHLAASYETADREMVRLLLSAGANGGLADNDGTTPLDAAVEQFILSFVDRNDPNLWDSLALNELRFDIVHDIRRAGGICLVETNPECGLIMRPAHSTVTIGVNHSGAVHTVIATDSLRPSADHFDSEPDVLYYVSPRPNAATIYSLVHSNGLSLTVNSETGVLSLPADSGVLTAGHVATASIQATTDGGTQNVTVEVVIEVSAADDGNAGLFHPPDMFQNPPLQLIPPAWNQFKPPKLTRVRPPTIPKSPAILGAPPLSRFRVS